MASIGTLWGSIWGFMGSIGALWVMYGIHRDPMGLYRGCIGSIGALRSWGWGYMCSIGTLWGSVGAV